LVSVLQIPAIWSRFAQTYTLSVAAATVCSAMQRTFCTTAALNHPFITDNAPVVSIDSVFVAPTAVVANWSTPLTLTTKLVCRTHDYVCAV
jgi:hypothetical protein